ncbi:MAG TPA: 5'/3'-nucleotidase SurE [Spirochaetia bacterium]|nr:5'/3'-nucleotidase SurE [Spirochaetales bacterium]HRY80704.1 5'/3'-nucleotidase SurE [Spirochaetia bacterium]
MKILVTNDDGIHCEGLRVLAEELGRDHEVWVFSPDGDRSGSSHSMTLRSPGKVRALDERTYTCSGMPADCVILAFRGAIPFRPELVVSGINRGPNLGTDIVYSGTAAAARQAVLHGIPGIAVSLASYGPAFDFRPAARFVRSNLGALLAAWDASVFLNVNVPPGPDADTRGAVFTRPGKRTYRDSLHTFEAPDGFTYCFLTGETIDNAGEEAADTSAVDSGLIAVTKVLVDPQVPPAFPAGQRFP